MAVLLVCAAIMVGGVFYTSCMSSQNGGPSGTGQTKVAMRVAGTPIDAQYLSEAMNQSRTQQLQFGIPASPDMELASAARTIEDAVDSAARATLVQKSGAPLDDASLLKVATEALDDDVQSMRDRLSMMGGLKPNATEKEIDDAFKSQTGRTPAEYKAQSLEQIKEALADESRRNAVLMMVAPKILEQQAAAKLSISDADIEHSYDRLEVKRILIKNNVPGQASVDERLAKAQAALKSGTSFEQAIDRFSEELPFGGKKLSETTTTVTGTTLLSDPAMKPLRGLKAGQVSEPVSLPDGKAIYKVVSVKSDVPKDFKAKKDTYKKQVLSELTRKGIEDQLTQFKTTPGNVTFDSAGYKAVWDFQLAQKGVADSTGKDINARMQSIYDEATKAAKAGGYDERAATLARYGAINQLWNAPTSDKSKLRPELIDTLKAVLERMESFEIRMRLVDLYREAKQYPEAVQQLTLAAQNNKTDATGKTNDALITTKLGDMLKNKEITPEQKKAVDEAQRQWRTLQQEAERQQEEVRKAQAKAAAEAAKANAKPGATTGTTGGTPGPVAPGPVAPGPVSPVPTTPAPGATTAGTPAPATTGGATTSGAPKK